MKLNRAIAGAAATVLGISAVVASVGAYATYGQWATPSVSFYVNPANADVTESAATSALQAGMNVWNTQSGTTFRFSYAGRVNDTTTGYDNRNVILFRNASSGSTIASTYSWSSNGKLVDSDIIFWDGGFQFYTGSSGCTAGAYIEDIASHEMGHVLGMSHSSDPASTMYASYNNCSQELRTLAADDIAGVQTLYPRASGPVDTAPTVTIMAPGNGASTTEGTAIAFSGSAVDTPDGDIGSNLVWRSSINGQIGTGTAFSTALTAGTHTITATATDSTGHSTQQAIVVNITSAAANTAPSVTISSPSMSAAIASGAPVTFSGSASDTEDGNLTSALVWRSNIDGQIGTGGSFTRTLSAGDHMITATVVDSGGLTTQRAITLTVTAAAAVNTAPSVTISSPGNGASIAAGATVTFSGSASDKEDGNLTAGLVWRSSIDGALGTGGSVTGTLRAGSHTITATVADSGALLGQRSITVNVAAPAAANTAPSVTISSPGNGATVAAGTSISFSGSASDTQDGNLSGSLIWQSSIDGQIGTGAAFTRALSTGAHTITATATDSGGLTTQRSVSLTVNAPVLSSPQAPAGATLTARGYKVKGLAKADLAWSGLSGGSVDVYRNGAKITTTSNSGAVTDAIDARGSGTYTYKVCSAGTSTCTSQASVSF
jgi:hypothetical protein